MLAALKDYPEAQDILQKLGEKRLREAQRVARAYRRQPSPGGHDSSDNSTGKRIVDKLRSDVKGLKNVLRKSRRSTKPDESLELQPLTSKAQQLKRQKRIDDSQDVGASASEPPISPLGAGLPLLHRLRLLKEKQEREEKSSFADAGASHQSVEPVSCPLFAPICSTSSLSCRFYNKNLLVHLLVPLMQFLTSVNMSSRSVFRRSQVN